MPQRVERESFLRYACRCQTALEQTGSVTAAAKTAKISRERAYECRRLYPTFATLWDQALETGADLLADEARRRAFAGSDVLLMFLMKGLQPQKWRESRASVAPSELNRLIEVELQRIAKQKKAEEWEPIN
ncbi:MAG: hypothetical protein ND866_27420 [Pyrinomonadaceae bacterium]|nr:hypothetical protein [Pyrinomonadaceae bacterium]